jgi:endonuclease YncB( thermonuclease family)
MRKFSFLLLLVIFAFSINAFAQTKTVGDITDTALGDFRTDSFKEKVLVGKVVGVHDGDTCTVLDANKRQYKFRFNGIDAPELKMDFGQKSKKNLSNWIFGKTVTVKYSKKDKYGRYVGNIFIGGVDVNLEQIKAGLAWHFKKYADEQTESDRKEYADAEIKARESKLGFWSLPNPTAPWDYRANLRAKQAKGRETREYLTGAKGGCYYINSSSKKTYVNKKFCKQ